MKNVVGVKFKRPGKIYFFDPGNLKVYKNQYVIVQTSLGEEFGQIVVYPKKVLSQDNNIAPLKKIVRIATKEDIANYEANKKKEPEAFKICEQKIKQHKLKMNLISLLI